MSRKGDPPVLCVFEGYLPLAEDKLASATKCGGQPAYTAGPLPADVQARVDTLTTCRACGRKMFLLSQAYCPLPELEAVASGDGDEGGRPHNRMMYVFACNSASCADRPSDSWAAFSILYSDSDPAEKEDVNEEERQEEEDLLDAPPPREALGPFTFPPLALELADEPPKEVVVPTDVEKELIAAAEANMKAGNVADEDIQELEHHIDLKDKPIDVYFEKFRSRVARMPRQVLRYRRNGLPVFMNPEKTITLSVPPCARCGAARMPELQLMPTLLYFLKCDRYLPDGCAREDEGLDFATATVYVCSRACEAAALPAPPPAAAATHTLLEEFIFVETAPTMAEDVAADGRVSLRQYFSEAGAAAAAASAGPDEVD